MEKNTLPYISFMKYKLSCFKIQPPRRIEKKIHEDNNILKVMTIRHTQKWTACGEDNEFVL